MCDGSGVRVQLSVTEERSKLAYCTHCGRTLSVSPTRVGRNPVNRGNPEATIPRHKAVST